MPQPSFFDALEATFADLTPTGKRVAGYLLANPGKLPFETADSIAQQAGTTGISVGRLLRSLGYRNLDDVKHSLREDSSGAWRITDRLGAFRQQSGRGDALDRSLAQELAAIEAVYQMARGPVFAQVVEQLYSREAVFIVGIQSTRGLLNSFHSLLEYIRPKAFYVDGLSGTYADMLNAGFERPYILLADFRAYSSVTRKLCEAATDAKIPLALITDYHCPWARDFATDLLPLKLEVGQFWDSLAPLAALLNLLVSAVADRLGDRLDQRLARNRALQQRFGQFE
ncbi:MurR/RpiR family transcriptional regulator [Pseudomonas typographi]|uniref:MurR/RpiR family transcriptional regulator n=1 Tax=Pseudomonas typographi TaxID=2715964 RepID=A0ABR7Z7W1_9PSED|nr:MurR/RpiR family transcriptional regulator [Pseudomonas typographi]MBD1554649.1 MurR/RpiR family transcriptional regulator [Pseudomonas typographi]MBD1587146.1 MurR/RpiR family transcriptional regulator [Pseudomonas typographi]MBD1601404.1 MurR/RpiR family transcriptional regulator [Pseudomonas typographi]